MDPCPDLGGQFITDLLDPEHQIEPHFRINFLDVFRVGQRTEELVAGAPGPDPRGSWSRSVALRSLPISLLPKLYVQRWKSQKAKAKG
jgi:hypothetical protein